MPAFQRVFFFSNFLNHAFSYKVKKRSPSPYGAGGSSLFSFLLNARHFVSGILQGGAHRSVVDVCDAHHGEAATGQIDLDVTDAGNLADLLGHRVDAVPAGHADHGVGGSAHLLLPSL